MDEHVDLIDGPEVETRELAIPHDLHGERLDRALAVLLPEFSRSFSQQLLSEGCVSCVVPTARVMTKASAKVRMGERYQLILKPTPQSQAFKPETMTLEVMFEDAHLLVIDKPAGLVVHPAPGNWSGTLLNGLLARDEATRFLPRAGIVHRLDKDTSGLMVVAKTLQAQTKLVDQLQKRSVSRIYECIVIGVITSGGKIDAPIGRSSSQRQRMAVNDGGKPAVSHYRVLERYRSHTYTRVKLETGRTHQIRVHLASVGHPLLADATYGGRELFGMTRQALHATRLGFAHPASGEPLVFEAPPPPDLASVWHLLTSVG